MTEVYSVQDVYFNINKSNPPQLVVHAVGMASTSGWINAALRARQYAAPPADGVQDFDFVATPPSGIALQVLTPIAGTGEIQKEIWMQGIRVHAKSNDLTVMLSSKERSVEAV